jgi:hypothetical protein
VRLNRAIRVRQIEGLTDEQVGALTFGPMMGEMFAGAFPNEAAERAAWRRHRAKLMEKHDAGNRPFAYFKYELDVIPRCWIDMLGALLDAGQVDAIEAVAIEKADPMLAPNPPAAGMATTHDTSTEADRHSADAWARKCEICAQFHAFRGRDEVAGRYRQQAQEIREQLSGETDGRR